MVVLGEGGGSSERGSPAQVGGYDDERGTSAEIVQSLLSWFHAQRERFTLSLACLLGHNTRIADLSGRQVLLPSPSSSLLLSAYS
jgi:hypothetical protein